MTDVLVESYPSVRVTKYLKELCCGMGPIDALAPDGSYGRTSVYESYMRGQGYVSHPLRGLREDDMEGLCGYADPFPEKIIREG